MNKMRVLFVLVLSLLVFQGASVTQANNDAHFADLSVSKADSPDPVAVGETLTYKISVKNHGPADARGVMLKDALPRGVRLVSVEPADRCVRVADDSVVRDGHSIFCKLGDLANGSSTRVIIRVIPMEPGIIANSVAVEAEGPADPNPDNNRAAVRTMVNPADLMVVKEDAHDPVRVGERLVYNIKVTNRGPATSTSVMLIDRLPDTVKFVSAAASQGRCGPVVIDPAPGAISPMRVVRCGLGRLAPGESARVEIVVVPQRPGTIVNKASVSGNEPDPHMDNNMAKAETTVLPSEETCFGRPATIMGTPGNDILIGTNKDDVIIGLGGNDIIIGKNGNDRICAGPGNDVVIAGNGNDHVSGGDGNDLIVGGPGDDKLLGEDGNDLILGLPGNDAIDCGPGDDVGIGGPGVDVVENCETTKGAQEP